MLVAVVTPPLMVSVKAGINQCPGDGLLHRQGVVVLVPLFANDKSSDRVLAVSGGSTILAESTICGRLK